MPRSVKIPTGARPGSWPASSCPDAGVDARPDLGKAGSNALDRAAATRLSHENGDYLRHRTLTAIQYYIVHGENWL
ncbi:hypothetical protein [Nonomuraea polychroma]|uniref:hypothetical protein n=1 Tax=Nonomuraea polychroma TaxID=46176 RepID=UPI000FDD295B|nr:hypothetical protein [Nonomuraea polychroma]